MVKIMCMRACVRVRMHECNIWFSLSLIQRKNLSPNWGVIYGMTAFMLVCVVMLVIAVVIWRPKSFSRYPIRGLRPKYKAMGAPLPVVPIPGIADFVSELGPRGVAEGAASYESPSVRFELENFNVRTLYDKLEDQTLHMSSQLSRHQADLRSFFDRISQQTEKLKGMLDSMDVSALIKATRDASKGAEPNTQVSSEEPQKRATGEGVSTHVGMTAGGMVREDELMVSLQMLIEKAEKGQFGAPGGSTSHPPVSVL